MLLVNIVGEVEEIRYLDFLFDILSIYELQSVHLLF